MLLQFGLEAYIALGNAGEQHHAWVVTKTKENTPLFWESITGKQIDFEKAKHEGFYNTINCVFNNKKFYANIQEDDRIINTSFYFKDSTKWKALDQEKIKLLLPWAIPIKLKSFSESDKLKTEQVFEKYLMENIEKYISSSFPGRGPVKWHSALSSLLAFSLNNYEFSQIYNTNYGQDFFQSSVSNLVPHNFVFKAFPLFLSQPSGEQAWNIFTESAQAKDILESTGSQITFALHSKLFLYPDNISSFWVILAVIYKPIIQ